MSPGPRLSVVVPTLEEAGTVGELIHRLDQTLEPIDHEILVVDDGSSDGTRETARGASPHVRVIHRPDERGLSSAVVRGFDEARGTYVCVMDADLQHPPETVLDLIEAARWDQADLVVASRFHGKGEMVDFPTSRRVLSRAARRLTQAVCPMVREHGLTDPLSGFFLVRRDVLDVEALDPRGYKILVEILHRCPVETVTEVPFTFRGRADGVSNLTAGVAWDFLAHLGQRCSEHRENRRLVQFALVGLTGVLVNLGILVGLKEGLGWHYLVSAGIAIEASILWNFALDDAWTFRDRRQGAWWQRCWRFNTVSLTSMGVNLSVLTVLTELLGVHYLLSEGAAILVAFLANYAGNLSWTYLTTEDPRVEQASGSRLQRGADWLRTVVTPAQDAPDPPDEERSG